jgi:hypothetical protein
MVPACVKAGFTAIVNGAGDKHSILPCTYACIGGAPTAPYNKEDNTVPDDTYWLITGFTGGTAVVVALTG